MKSQSIFKMIGVGAVMIAGGSAQAGFTGVSFENSNSFFLAHPNPTVAAAFAPVPGPNTDFDVYRMYANFNSNTAQDRVNAVRGNEVNPLVISTSGTFYNYTEPDPHGGPPIHFHLAFTGSNPVARSWDTYVTIGNAVNGGVTSLSPGFDVETGNLGASSNMIYSENVTWFITPADAQGQAVATAPGQAPAPAGIFRVLLGQFTVSKNAFLSASGMININGQETPFLVTIPAPGAMMLLGVAGLIGTRRRRND